jgi:hypothetical protein
VKSKAAKRRSISSRPKSAATSAECDPNLDAIRANSERIVERPTLGEARRHESHVAYLIPRISL